MPRADPARQHVVGSVAGFGPEAPMSSAIMKFGAAGVTGAVWLGGSGEALLGCLPGDLEDRGDGRPWLSGFAGAGDGVVQGRGGLPAGVAGGRDLEQGARIGQLGGRNPLADGGSPLVAARA